MGSNDNDSAKALRSYIFLNGKVEHPIAVVELAKKHLPLIYAAELKGDYRLLLETKKTSEEEIEKFVTELEHPKYEKYNVGLIYGRQALLYPRSVALAYCRGAVRSPQSYLNKGIARVELIEGKTESNVFFFIEGEPKEATALLESVIHPTKDRAAINHIVRVLFPEYRTPVSGLWKEEFNVKPTEDCVDLVRAEREAYEQAL